MDNTADKLNELEGPYYDSGTVRALQEFENSANSTRSWPTQNFVESTVTTCVLRLQQQTLPDHLQVAYYMKPCLLSNYARMFEA